jgi:toxin YoeB
MVRKVVWTKESLENKLEILTYWLRRNKSNTYSRKLDAIFKGSMKEIAKFPSLGKPTKRDSIKYIIIGDYLMFYKHDHETLNVLHIWDTRRDPKQLKFEL